MRYNKWWSSHRCHQQFTRLHWPLLALEHEQFGNLQCIHPGIEATRFLSPLPSLGYQDRWQSVFVGSAYPERACAAWKLGKLIAAFKPGYQGWQSRVGDKRQLQDSPARPSEDCVAHGANGETEKEKNPKSGQEESRCQLNASPDLGFCIT